MSAGAEPEIFQGRGDFVDLGHFDKHKVKKKREKTVPQRSILGIFLLDFLKTFLNFLMDFLKT